MSKLNSNTESNNSKQRWWVKFNPVTGKISRISPKKIISNTRDQLVFESDYIDAFPDILTGKISLKTCKVIEDLETSEWKVVPRSNQLHIKKLIDRLHHVKPSNPNKVCVNIEYFTKTDIFEVSLNFNAIKSKMNLSEIYDVKVQDDVSLNLYITQRNNPDALVQEIDVDPVLLMKNKKIQIQTSLSKYIDTQDISVYTCPIFPSYSLQINQTVASDEHQSQSNKYLQQAINTDQQQHLTLQRDGENVLNVNSGLINESNHYILEGQRSLEVIICDSDPDCVLGGVSLNTEKLVNESSQQVELKFKLPDNPLFLYQCKSLTVNYLGENYVNQH